MKRVPRIEVDTPIIPGIVAWCVWDDARVWLGEPLPRRWVRELVAEANTVYAHCKQFRQAIRRTGNRGRDYLWMFMRHWLAAKLYEYRPHLHARMPRSYNIGEPLPPRPSRSARLLPRLPACGAGLAGVAAHFHSD
jgi:hypothetical protein